MTDSAHPDVPAKGPALVGPVHVVGAGLLGTSVALACRRAGLEVLLSDRQNDHVRTATGLGAGIAYDGRPVQLVVVAVPPDGLGPAVADALGGTDAFVTDVGSVKSRPLHEVLATAGAEAARRYVGSHPMAGSERSGPLAATETLFDGRPWAVTPHDGSSVEAVAVVRSLAEQCGAGVVEFAPDAHDRAVARTSHLPQILSSVTAARLLDAPADHLMLSGQGVRDVTRVAGGDPGLWQQILAANGAELAVLLREVRDDLDRYLAAVEHESRVDLAALLSRGVEGTRALPGKHGGPALPTALVYVTLSDHPGELARVFGDAGESGVNIEDVRIDHDPGRPVGLLELTVAADAAEEMVGFLEGRGWDAHR